MRRLQSNLAYLAAIADRSHKPSSQIPPHPAIMSAPHLIPKSPRISSPAASTSSPQTGLKKEEGDEKKFEESEEDRDKILQEQYKRLQALFPGVDPKKEPPIQPVNAAARAQQQATQAQKLQQGPGGDTNLSQQSQVLLRGQMQQRMIQEQAQKQQMAQAMAGVSPQGQIPGR